MNRLYYTPHYPASEFEMIDIIHSRGITYFRSKLFEKGPFEEIFKFHFD